LRGGRKMLKKNGDRIIGKHVYGNLYGVDEKKLWDEKFLKRTIEEAAKIADMTLLETKSWKIATLYWLIRAEGLAFISVWTCLQTVARTHACTLSHA
jgi:S-adenosylmethionine/arginine decarboxylase-like enzyme